MESEFPFFDKTNNKIRFNKKKQNKNKQNSLNTNSLFQSVVVVFIAFFIHSVADFQFQDNDIM